MLRRLKIVCIYLIKAAIIMLINHTFLLDPMSLLLNMVVQSLVKSQSILDAFFNKGWTICSKKKCTHVEHFLLETWLILNNAQL